MYGHNRQESRLSEVGSRYHYTLLALSAGKNKRVYPGTPGRSPQKIIQECVELCHDQLVAHNLIAYSSNIEEKEGRKVSNRNTLFRVQKIEF
jgi:hypothetical protein